MTYGTTGNTRWDDRDGVEYTRCVALVKSAATAW
jgi:hypothetical protein